MLVAEVERTRLSREVGVGVGWGLGGGEVALEGLVRLDLQGLVSSAKVGLRSVQMRSIGSDGRTLES